MNKYRVSGSLLMQKDFDLVVEVRKEGHRWNAYDQEGHKVSPWIGTGQRQKAERQGMALRRLFYKDGRPYWRLIPQSEFDAIKASRATSASSSHMPKVAKATENVSDTYDDETSRFDTGGVYKPFLTQEEVVRFLSTCYSLKPRKLFVNELKWKHCLRTIVRGKNVMITGMQGSGKTLFATSAAKSIGRPFFSFPVGMTQDPKAYLLGSTHFDKDSGTVFYASRFVRAVQTKGAVILLDELSRAHPEAWNILMSVLDESQRYLILDGSRENALVHVAEGVTFIATANIGSEFTATRVFDRALTDRFTFIEIDELSAETEAELLKMYFPSVDKTMCKAVAEIAAATRTERRSSTAKLTNAISTRLSVETCSLLFDGFSLPEAAELAIYPFFSEDGGLDSERTYVKQLVQRYVGDEQSMPFSDPDVQNAPNSR